jgi:hypothetical protein
MRSSTWRGPQVRSLNQRRKTSGWEPRPAAPEVTVPFALPFALPCVTSLLLCTPIPSREARAGEGRAGRGEARRDGACLARAHALPALLAVSRGHKLFN